MQGKQSKQDETELIGAEEVARILGVHQTTVNRWVDRGFIVPFIRLPSGTVRFNRNYILEKREEFRDAAKPKDDGDAA